MIADSLPPPAPPMEDPRYLVEDPRAIRQLLEELIKRTVPLSVRPEDSDLASPSLVLSISPDESVELDGSNVAAVNSRIGRSRRLYCQAELDKVEIRFALDNPVAQQTGSRVSFKTQWPARIYHHQRRELFRLKTPLQGSPQLFFECGDPPQSFQLRITDISVGGVGVQHSLPADLLALDSVLEDCCIALPDDRIEHVRLKVVNERPITLPDGRTVRRSGLAFERLPQSAQSCIGRYIFAVERQRKARSNGKD